MKKRIGVALIGAALALLLGAYALVYDPFDQPAPAPLTCEQRLAEDAAGLYFNVSRDRMSRGRIWVQLQMYSDARASTQMSSLIDRDLDLTGLSPAMIEALIAQTKDEMYCTWLKHRQDGCRSRAVADSLNAVVRQWAGPYQPTPGVCAEKPKEEKR